MNNLKSEKVCSELNHCRKLLTKLQCYLLSPMLSTIVPLMQFASYQWLLLCSEIPKHIAIRKWFLPRFLSQLKFWNSFVLIVLFWWLFELLIFDFHFNLDFLIFGMILDYEDIENDTFFTCSNFCVNVERAKSVIPNEYHGYPINQKLKKVWSFIT